MRAKDLKTLEEIIGMAYKLMKKAFKSGKCKLKPQWNTVTRMAKIRMTTPIVAEDVKQWGLSNIANGNLKWY